MPTRITIEHYLATAGKYWTNRYWTSDPWTAAGTTMDAIVAAHKAIHRTTVLITKIRVDDGVEDTNNYDTVAVNEFGTAAVGSSQQVPLWITARVDFDVAGGGSPSRKYLRGVLTELDLNFYSPMDPGQLAAMNTYGNAIVAIGTIIDDDGSAFVDAVPYPFPQMRQLGRKSKKKATTP